MGFLKGQKIKLKKLKLKKGKMTGIFYYWYKARVKKK